MIKKSTSWTVLFYGLVLIVLGYLGYYLQGSVISLYSGVGSGAILIVSSLLMFGSIRIGSYVALIITLVLTITFIIRYMATSKGLPGILALISACMLIFLLTQITRWRK